MLRAMKHQSNAPYPILEFDPAREAFIEPSKVIKPRDVPEHCVLCFFSDVIDVIVAENDAKVIVENRWEDGPHPLYEIKHGGKRLAFMHPGIGGPLAGSLLEEVIGFGCRKFIACGGCGALDPDIAVGNLIVVTAAVRDEGVSYHYLPPGREIGANKQAISALENALRNNDAPYRLGKTWTTAAPYRETHARIAARKSEGCIAVEMEAAAMMAVAQHRQVILGQVLYGGDDLSGETWDDREWQKHEDIRERLFWLAAEACLGL
jgi:uridine phosphorylase